MYLYLYYTCSTLFRVIKKIKLTFFNRNFFKNIINFKKSFYNNKNIKWNLRNLFIIIKILNEILRNLFIIIKILNEILERKKKKYIC
jgi:hypothetical protein